LGFWAGDELPTHPEKGQCRPPLTFPGLAISYSDRRVPVVVAADRPLKAEREQGRPFDNKGSRRYRFIVGPCSAGKKSKGYQCQQQLTHPYPTFRSKLLHIA